MPKLRPFKNVRTARPSRSLFDLSYSKQLSCDMGQLIPIACDEVIPGDKLKIWNQLLIRMNPLVAPAMHEINAYVHWFEVPYRILWDGWEEFITGGVDGDDSSTVPRWDPTGNNYDLHSLWDYFGFPVDIIPAGALPLDFPRRAYCEIWNQYYRDETLQTELDITDLTNDLVLLRNWSKDYFTSALLTELRGTPPALPITGMGAAEWDTSAITDGVPASGQFNYVESLVADPTIKLNGSTQARDNFIDALNNNTVDLSGATTFTVSDLRLAFQIQKWMERNNRGGVRYKEFLQMHWGVTVSDSRLQRPSYIGGMKVPIIISETLQTSETTVNSPQGNLGGHGVAIDNGFVGEVFIREYGLVMGILSIMPVPMYTQGVDRQWLRRTRYDFPFPEFANLSEQAIEQAELYATAVANENTAIFGYQGRYDELRTKRNMAVGLMRDDTGLAHWNLARIFSSSPDLNEDFIKCVPDKRIFAVTDEPGFIVTAQNIIRAVRPIPVVGEPGLIDHN